MRIELMTDLRMQIAGLAHEMVWLEDWTHQAYAGRNWARVGELQGEREETQQRRSQLMRELWSLKGNKRVREALREL
jgi:hypothetical protein